MSSPEWLPVLDLIVVDASNPRSILFQAKGVLGYLEVLQREYGPCGVELLSGHVQTLTNMDPGKHLNPESKELRNVISGLRRAALDLNDRLTQRFFNVGQARNWSSWRA
jgi:uncharacterized alpha-E superfamily protein